MDRVPQLPIYDNTPEGLANRRVDQGVGTYSDYYDPDPLAGRGTPVERRVQQSLSPKPRKRKKRPLPSYYRPYCPPEPELSPEEQSEVNRKGIALVREALARVEERRKRENLR